MRLVNLTQHPINLGFQDINNVFQTREIPRSGTIASIEEKVVEKRFIQIQTNEDTYKVPVKIIELGKILNLPPKAENQYYIVGMAVARRAYELGLGRDDLVGPYTEKSFYIDGKMYVPGLVHYDFKSIGQSPLSQPSEQHDPINTVRNLSFQLLTLGAQKEGELKLVCSIPKEAVPAAIDSKAVDSDPIDSVPCYSLALKDIKNLPDFVPGTLLFTAMPVAQDGSFRPDVYTGDFSTVQRVDGTSTNYFSGLVRYIKPKAELLNAPEN